MATEKPTDAPRLGPGAEPDAEDLPRMSFGDHLDELRRRVIWTLLAILGGIVIVLPFKDAVTEIYVGPYQAMWAQAYARYLDELDERKAEYDARLAESGAEQDKTDELFLEDYRFHDKWRQEILAGTYPEDAYYKIHAHGFRVPRVLKALGGLEDFWVFMAATFLFGLVLSLPVVLYQVWAFVAAGLYRHERRVVMRLLPAAVGLTTVGVLFGYLFVVPTGLFFLIRLMDFGNVEPLLSVQQYFSFLLTLTAALGIIFQLPMLMLAVHRVGIFTNAQMLRNWRYVVLGFFVLSAMVTPPDPFTQLMMAGPMVLLYGVGLVLTWRAEVRAARVEVDA